MQNILLFSCFSSFSAFFHIYTEPDDSEPIKSCMFSHRCLEKAIQNVRFFVKNCHLKLDALTIWLESNFTDRNNCELPWLCDPSITRSLYKSFGKVCFVLHAILDVLTIMFLSNSQWSTTFGGKLLWQSSKSNGMNH